MRDKGSLLDCCTPLAGSSLSVEDARDLEQLFVVLADRHRLRILNMLLTAAGESICVCEFTASLGLAQPKVSYHLKKLTEAGLLERERRARFVYYAIAPRALERMNSLLGFSLTTHLEVA